MVKLNMQRQQNLTKNQKIVLDIIEKSTEPLKAYSILSNVKKKGINAPPQVYRALDKLVDMGLSLIHISEPTRPY